MASVLATPTSESIAAISKLASLVSDNPQNFLRPTIEEQQIAIRAVKLLLDPLATSVANSQVTRRDENRKKRKRGDGEQEPPVLQLRQVYTKGFGVKQVWEQAKRILDAAQSEVERDVHLHPSIAVKPTKVNIPLHEASSDDGLSGEEAHESDFEIEADDLEEDLEDVELDDEIEDEQEEEHEPDEDIEADSDILASSDEETRTKQNTYVQDPNNLNDGFFSIDEFNKQSQFLEQMDARGEEDNPSDEDEVDWDADPLATNSSGLKSGKPKGVEDDSENEGDGPTFGNADLDASDDEDGNMMDEDQDQDGMMGGLSNANEIGYAEFFEPPPKKPSKTKRMRALPKTQPPKETTKSADQVGDDEVQLQNDLERAMADVRRDLLDSEDENEDMSDEEEDASDDGLGPRKTSASNRNLSTHEKQRAAIAAEIRRLEAANVAKRDWQLSGEARAVDRPVNSLIEEDLEFERAGKPIAPVTAETTEEIDALIKRRILTREFDEVVRRVPGSLNLAGETRRGRIEVDDAKPQASLGEIYEAEHQKNADPLSYVDKRSAAVKKQHAEIDVLWKQVRDQLDILSNMHFKPKRVEVEVKTVEDKPRIAMEDARPVGEIESGEGGMLAPQEVYKPGVDSRGGKDEVVLQGGTAISREEMSREEKLRRRRRQKERSKKSQANNEVQVLGKQRPSKKKEKETEKANIIEDLKRGGVKVVGKDGELQSIGKQKKGQREGREVIVSNLKL